MADPLGFCAECVRAAAGEPLFSPWAVAHGLGFDFGAAWRESGPEFWTLPDLDFLNFYDARYAAGGAVLDGAKAGLLLCRNVTAAKVARYYAAFCEGLPPESSPARAQPCYCL